MKTVEDLSHHADDESIEPFPGIIGFRFYKAPLHLGT